jgi:hypothetical protein
MSMDASFFAWSTKSPVLNLLGLYLWGYLNSIMYGTAINDVLLC